MRGVALGLALSLAACGGPGDGGSPSGGSPPDLSSASLIILSLDTLRADFTSFGGGAPELSPALARFAEEGVVFTAARSQAPHTAPSHMSLFTATWPSVHGVQNVAHKTGEDGRSQAVIVPLRPDIPTLAEVLKAAGFTTIGLTDGGNLNPPHGFARGFDHYTYDLRGAEAQVQEGLAQLPALAAPDAGRFFLFWHTYQIHAPYVPPAPYIERWAPAGYDGLMRERIATLGSMGFKERFGAMRTVFWKDKERFGPAEADYFRGLYAGGVRFTDDTIGPFLDALRTGGLLDRSIVVLLSDHGEEFFEHGQWQHDQVFEECVRVPLVVRLPGGFGGGRRVDVPVALMDVMPTVLELLGIDAGALQLPGPPRAHGKSFAATLLGGRDPTPRPIISEHVATRGGNFDHVISLHANDMTLLYDKVRGERLADGSVRQLRALHDLTTDPGQQLDLADGATGRHERALAALQAALAAFEKIVEFESRPPGEHGEIEITDPETLRQLEELGYIERAR